MDSLIQQSKPSLRKRLLQSRRSGFTLVMTLLLIAVAVTLTADFARRSMARATDSLEAVSGLQRRWGMQSVARTVLPQIEKCFVKHGEFAEEAVAWIDVQLQLAGMRYQLRLADEQAKVNLNRVFEQRGRQSCQAVVQELTVLEGDNAVMLQPSYAGEAIVVSASRERSPNPSERPSPRAFVSLDQLVVHNPPELIRSISENLTCWGDGRVNIHRASAPVLTLACQPDLSSRDAQRLVDQRREMPGAGAAELIAQLELTTAQNRKLADHLTDQSQCHSLWITVTDDHRLWHLFLIEERSADGKEVLSYRLTW